jgi:hypothetical protein
MGTKDRPDAYPIIDGGPTRIEPGEQSMDHTASPTECLARRLTEKIEQVSADFWKIEVWAGALSRFASPVPVYEPGNWNRHTRAPVAL